MENKSLMNITLHSGLSCDGFNVSIFDSKMGEIFREHYSYGWNASHNSGATDPRKPYTTNIIKSLMKEYNIDFKDIVILPGIHVFNGEQMSQKEVDHFKSKYLSKLND